jgi:hypothetical protein
MKLPVAAFPVIRSLTSCPAVYGQAGIHPSSCDNLNGLARQMCYTMGN